MSDDLLMIVKRLRIENEVNKTLIHSLKQVALFHKNEKINECLESINFMSGIAEVQIKQSWSAEEAELFRQLMNNEIKQFSLLYDNS